MEKAQAEKLHLTSMPQSYLLNKAPYFCDIVMRELEKLGFTEQEISQGGYKIVTTLDYKTQIKTNEAIITEVAYGITSARIHFIILVLNIKYTNIRQAKRFIKVL